MNVQALSPIRSLNALVLGAVALGLLAGCGVVIGVQTMAERGLMVRVAHTEATQLTSLIASQAAQGIATRDPDAIERTYFELVRDDADDGDAVDVATIRAMLPDGTTLKSYLSIEDMAFPEDALIEPGRAAAAEGVVVTRKLDDYVLIAAPVFGATHDAPIGAMGMAWKEGERVVGLLRQAVPAIAVAAVLAVAAIAAVLLLLRRLVTRPLDKLSHAMEAVRSAGGATVEGDVPGIGRKDEIGVLAREFRALLGEVAVRRHELIAHGEALARARDVSERANARKSDFLATMSHEIRTPMNGVLGMATALLEGTLDPDQCKVVGIIVESSESLLGIVNDILDLSKLEAGKVDLERINFDPRETVRQIADLVQSRATGRPIQVSCAIGDDLPPAVTGDPHRLRQILLNFVSNALKFTTEGAVTIAVRREAVREDGSVMIRFEVADTGPGIPPDRLDTLFSDYVQVDASVSRRFGGTGLGLAICKRLAERMGGAVGVASTLGSGSTFHATLPFTIAETVERGAPAASAEAAEAELRALVKTRATPLRVLVADDNETNQLVATSMLARLGIASDVAENGALAGTAVRDGAYDLVLMDMQIPEMDGLEATCTIRALGGDKARTPIVGLTANAFGDDRRRCREAGMDGFLAKPVRRHELARGIAEALAAAAATRP